MLTARHAFVALAFLIPFVPASTIADPAVLEGQFLAFEGNIAATADGRIGVALTEVFPRDGQTALLTTFDARTGSTIDSALVGFGPVGVRVAGSGATAVVAAVTDEGGPVAVSVLALDASGRLTPRGKTTLTTSSSAFGSEPVVSARGDVGFILVASDSGTGKDLVTFSLADASVVSRTPVVNPGESLGLYEDGHVSRLVLMSGSLADGFALVAFDVSDRAAPALIAHVPLRRNLEASGDGSAPSFAFCKRGRFVVVASPYLELAAVDLKKRSLASSMGGTSPFVRVASNHAALLAVYTADPGTGQQTDALLLVDASRPKHLRTLGRLDVENDHGAVLFAFSESVDQLIVTREADIDVYSIPTLTATKHLPSEFPVAIREIRLLPGTGRALFAAGYAPALVESVSVGR